VKRDGGTVMNLGPSAVGFVKGGSNYVNIVPPAGQTTG
jgi:hypothetical protein